MKASREEILVDLIESLDESAVSIYRDSQGEILSAGVVCFDDAQMFYSGVDEMRSK